MDEKQSSGIEIAGTDLKPSNAEATFDQSIRLHKIFENQLNLFILVFIEWLSLKCAVNHSKAEATFVQFF